MFYPEEIHRHRLHNRFVPAKCVNNIIGRAWSHAAVGDIPQIQLSL